MSKQAMDFEIHAAPLDRALLCRDGVEGRLMVDPLRLCARLGDEVTDLRRLAAYDVDTLLADATS